MAFLLLCFIPSTFSECFNENKLKRFACISASTFVFPTNISCSWKQFNRKHDVFLNLVIKNGIFVAFFFPSVFSECFNEKKLKRFVCINASNCVRQTKFLVLEIILPITTLYFINLIT